MELFKEITDAVNVLSGIELYCFIASQIIGLIATVLGIVAGQVNNKKTILILELILNFLCALAAILVGGFNGAIVCLLACVAAVFLYGFDKRDIKTPTWFYICAFTAFLVSGIITFALVPEKHWFDILPIPASMLFVLGVAAKKPTYYRIYFVFNSSLWIVYNFCITAYTSILTQAFLLVSLIIGIIRLDILKKDSK